MNEEKALDLETITTSYARLREAIGRVVVGQESPLRLILVTLLCSGHSLFEGVPGVGKTLLVRRSLAAAVDVRFGRVQFTPDLMPSDVIGTPMLDPSRGEFRFRPGPLFTDLLLADEINRASAKTQAALLEAMQERGAHRRRKAARARAPVRRLRDAESGRARGHVPASRGGARPLPVQDRHGLPRARPRSGRSSPCTTTARPLPSSSRRC